MGGIIFWVLKILFKILCRFSTHLNKLKKKKKILNFFRQGWWWIFFGGGGSLITLHSVELRVDQYLRHVLVASRHWVWNLNNITFCFLSFDSFFSSDLHTLHKLIATLWRLVECKISLRLTIWILLIDNWRLFFSKLIQITERTKIWNILERHWKIKVSWEIYPFCSHYLPVKFSLKL